MIAAGDEDVDLLIPTNPLTRLTIPRKATVIVIGATSVTREVTAIGDVLDLRIVVVDPRPPFATSARLGEGARVIAGRPDGVLVVAAVAVAAFKYIRDDASQAVISVCIPFLAYLPAYRFGFSGVLATVTAGVVLSRYTPIVLAPNSRQLLFGFWVVVIFLIDAFVFVEVGIGFHHIIDALRRSAAMLPR
jgi:CPA1 family monovalent cation:H+ antiporter